MPELKQPQEAAKTTTEQPLTTKKKRAMLEYMAIMFAAAFLLVAISLLIKPCCERLCILILRTDIIELLDRGSPDILHTDFLSLINKRNSPEQNTDSSQHLDSGIVLPIIRQEHAGTSRLIMIFNNIGIPSEGFHLRLGSKKGTSPCLKIHRLRFIPSMFPQTE